MAREIYVASASGPEVGLLFYLPLSPAILPAPTPSSSLAAAELADLQADDAAKVAALDAGALYAWRTNYRPPPGETGPQALAKVREMYATALAVIPAEVAAQYAYASRVGNFYDAV